MPRIVILHATLLLLALYSLAVLVQAQTRTISRPLDVQGHRGARGLMPENTMPAFEKAIALGVTTLEMDIYTTQDGVIVVYHDQRLNAKLCAYDDGRRVPKKHIEQFAYEDLANIDCGARRNARFPQQQPVPEARIPTLEQVLALARDANYPVRVSIEVKWEKRKNDTAVREIAQRLVVLIKRYGLTNRSIVQSFHAPVLVAVAKIEPNIQRAILVRDPEKYDRVVSESNATILSPRYDGLDTQDVKRFKARNIAVIPWTVNRPADICRLMAWGVDGMISDYPDRVIELHNGGACDGGKQ